MSDLIRSVEAPANEAIPPLRPGDLVKVFIRIREGANERTQEFRGTIIRLRNSGNNANFTVRRVASNGIGVERTFLMRSPRLEKVVVERHSHVRRAQLYFLRDRTGKRSRLKQKFNA
ncbi:MAG: 50S ribosomal protein L19 [Anaerolineales bacterium]|nr:50S ribosomal protein L19 [Anaerolineales bacterium]MDD5468345.1 50S ribosomal protein L19 [Anaerolineales bacterium]